MFLFQNVRLLYLFDEFEGWHIESFSRVTFREWRVAAPAQTADGSGERRAADPTGAAEEAPLAWRAAC